MLKLTNWIDWLSWFINKTWLLDINPEFCHDIAMIIAQNVEKSDLILDLLREQFYLEDKSLEFQIWNVNFKNPVWLAAWFTKKSNWLKFWETFWFWYINIWWITALSQTWNQKPRIFKFSDIMSVVNWMWLPWDWIDAEVKRLETRKQLWMMPNIPLIANLCNSAITKEDEKIDEFKLLMKKLYSYVAWFEVNVSCPNQWGVCDMQQESKLKNLLIKLQEYNEYLAVKLWCEKKIILVKIAPLTSYQNEPEKIKDLTKWWLEMMTNVFNEVWIDWVTATNTSQEHNLWTKIIRPDWQIIWWGMSWLWLHEKSLKTVPELRNLLNQNIPIIWVWWIWYDNTWKDVINMLNEWATWLWILSSFVQKSVATPYNLKKTILENRKK